MEKQLKDLEDRDQNIILQWVERQKEQLEVRVNPLFLFYFYFMKEYYYLCI